MITKMGTKRRSDIPMLILPLESAAALSKTAVKGL
jgi:hypothetical protein